MRQIRATYTHVDYGGASIAAGVPEDLGGVSSWLFWIFL
jgi:hypothetical protein